MEVALIGKGPSRKLAPYKGQGVTTWGVNDIVAKRECDVCFWMDRHLMHDTQTDKLIVTAVNHTKTPMYSVHPWDDVQTCIVYPRNEIAGRFGTDYFSDSCCYMIALAIYQGFTHLSLYGFEYGWGTKYEVEKPCVSMWLGIALGMGLSISLYGDECELFKTVDGFVYSYGDEQSYPRENIKMARFSPPADGVEFSVEERIRMVGILPKTGRYDVVSFSKKLRAELEFTPKEAKKLNFRQQELNSKNPILIWDDTDIPPKKIEMNTAQKAMVASWLHNLEKKGELDYHSLGLYEKFCRPNESG